MTTWHRRTDRGWVLNVHIQPGAGSSGVSGLHGERLKIRISAPPVEGKANEALIDLVAARLGVPKRKITVLKGAASRDKQLLVADPCANPERLLDEKGR